MKRITRNLSTILGFLVLASGLQARAQFYDVHDPHLPLLMKTGSASRTSPTTNGHLRDAAPVFVFAHRGITDANHDEDSIESALNTSDQSVEGMELDVYESADRVPYLMHDQTLKRMTGQPYYSDIYRWRRDGASLAVATPTWAEISKYNLCFNGSDGHGITVDHPVCNTNPGVTVPTLQQALSALYTANYQGIVFLDLREVGDVVDVGAMLINSFITDPNGLGGWMNAHVVMKIQTTLFSGVNDFWNQVAAQSGAGSASVIGPLLSVYPVYTSFGVAPLDGQGSSSWALNDWASWEAAYANGGRPLNIMGPEVDLKAIGAILNYNQDDLFTHVWQEGRSEGVYSPSAECTVANPSTAISNLTGDQGVYIEGGGCGPIVPQMGVIECGGSGTFVYSDTGAGCTDHRSIQAFWYNTAQFGSVLSDNPVGYINFLGTVPGLRPASNLNCVGACLGGGGGTGPIITGTGGPANPPTYVPTIQTDNLYKILNVNSNQVLGVAYAALNAGADVIQYTDNGTNDHLWHIMPAGPNQYLIVNYNSGECLGITMGSLTAGAFAQQWSDNGSGDHLWTFVDAGNGMVKIKNVQSGLYLGIDNGLTTPGLRALQWVDNGTPDHLWRLQLTTSISFMGPGLESGSVTPVHDPSMIKDNSIGKYHLFATGGTIMERYSTDRTAFGPGTESYNFAFSTIPTWAQAYNKTDLWAPDASWDSVHKSWTLYYAASTFGSNHSAIGVATSANAEPQTWVDSGGPVLTSDTCSGTNAIDPALVTDPSNGNQFLSFGSWWGGIYMIRIDPNTHQQFGGDKTCYHLASRFVGTDLEGSYVYPHGGYYYLFMSAGLCCQAWNSTYHVLVGRATTVTGPYVDRAGVPLTLGGGTVFLGTHANVIGPGGGTVMPDVDGDLYVYHWYDLNNHGMQTLGINRIIWSTDGWPSIN